MKETKDPTGLGSFTVYKDVNEKIKFCILFISLIKKIYMKSESSGAYLQRNYVLTGTYLYVLRPRLIKK